MYLSMSEAYSLKEMLSKVIDQNEKALVTQTELLHRARSVDSHLEQLNSKVAKQEKEIHTLKSEHTQVKAYAVAVSGFIGAAWSIVNFLSR